MKSTKILFIAFLVFLLIPLVHAKSEIFFFHSTGCGPCNGMFDYLIKFGKIESSISIHALNIDKHLTNNDMLDILCERYGITTREFPIVFIDDTAFVGYSPRIKEKIREKVEICKISECYSAVNIPLSKSLRVESGETSYIESYKTGSGLLQGLMLIVIIVLIAMSFLFHKQWKILYSKRKRRKVGKKRGMRKVR